MNRAFAVKGGYLPSHHSKLLSNLPVSLVPPPFSSGQSVVCSLTNTSPFFSKTRCEAILSKSANYNKPIQHISSTLTTTSTFPQMPITHRSNSADPHPRPQPSLQNDTNHLTPHTLPTPPRIQHIPEIPHLIRRRTSSHLLRTDRFIMEMI